MIILALDTSTQTVGIALYDGLQVLSEAAWTSRDHHTAELAPAVSDLLRRCRITVSQLGALAVALGPGSFTGLRIGLALAKGLALVRNIPMVGIPTLDVLAEAQPRCGLPMAAVLRAGRGRLAVGWYVLDPDRPLTCERIEVLTAAELTQKIQSPTWICGELSEAERRLLARKRKNVVLASPALSLRRAGYLAELGWQRWQAGQVDNPTELSPIYLHYNEPIPE
jgi:tRNA threonylcarbamoyladenosine biosynthesis protein TsaB